MPPRLRQPSQELTEAMSQIRYASTVWAMTRRSGENYNFSVTHQVSAGGAKDAVLRSATWFQKLEGVPYTPKQDADLELAQKTIQQVETSAAGWRRAFAEAARTAAVVSACGQNAPRSGAQARDSKCLSDEKAGDRRSVCPSGVGMSVGNFI